MEVKNVKKREANFELLRIIAMFMIVTLHYTQNSGVMENNGQLTQRNIFFLFMNVICSVGVNCFVLISGYYLIYSKFKIQKIIRLWGVILFYSLGIYLFYLIIGNDITQNMNILLKMYIFTPVLNVHYWFMVPYIALYIIFPFLNKIIKTFNKKQLETLLLIFFVLMCVINNITPLNQNFEAIGGHSTLWFMFLYSVGAYIRLYYKESKENVEKYKYIAIYMIFMIIAFIMALFLEMYSSSNIVAQWFSYRIIAFNSTFVFAGALCLFMYFKNIKINNNIINNTITWISSSVFAVYLIHEHEFIRFTIWQTGLNINVEGTSNYLLHYIISIFIIFAICILIDKIRKILFKGLARIQPFRYFADRLNTLYEKTNNKVENLMK